jgi:hypothetical protein
MTPDLKKTTFKEDKDYAESLINTRLNRLNQDKKKIITIITTIIITVHPLKIPNQVI